MERNNRYDLNAFLPLIEVVMECHVWSAIMSVPLHKFFVPLPFFVGVVLLSKEHDNILAVVRFPKLTHSPFYYFIPFNSPSHPLSIHKC